ncbi:DUF3558 domain-containing protein [Amycolatopsis magusensis]|uniref:DUF3558 domain-containing protein n=1 Tax=Amycolatopsis magusensis TaxID=882444 RepID=A0ABS4PT27_9PSEU|nr:DUF3558 domain-containing protein [Amycolatopsis magusensis]MBP2181988.1 hypothetical protein [Amycolatopsis magusensis]MDI5982400.1 DUF3558 domain-containing protein [Amycolatopsis magusensis]
MSRVPHLLLLLPALALATACAQGEPAASGGDTSTAADTAAPNSAPPGQAGLDPCTLLSSAERSTVGLTSVGEPKAIGSARTCDWTEAGTFGLAISVDESKGLADLRTEKRSARQIEVGGREGLKVADAKADDGTCAVLLGAGESASVQIDVSNTTFTGTEAACARADEVAGLVEPKLP